MICTRCGSTEVDGAVYCSGCGTSLAMSAPPAENARAATRGTATASPPRASALTQQQHRYQDSQSIGAAPMDTQVQRGSSSQRGFIASLFDFRFDSFVTPKVIRVVYVIAMIMIALSALWFLFYAFKIKVEFGIIALFILCPLYFFLYVALWRIALELIMVIFRIGDDLRAIRERRDLG